MYTNEKCSCEACNTIVFHRLINMQICDVHGFHKIAPVSTTCRKVCFHVSLPSLKHTPVAMSGLVTGSICWTWIESNRVAFTLAVLLYFFQVSRISNYAHMLICSRRPHNCKTAHFTSWKERKRQRNVHNWKMCVRSVQHYCFSPSNKYANLRPSCCRRRLT